MFLGSQVDKGNTINIMVIAKRMKDEGISPDMSTYNHLLRACVRERLYPEARAIFEDMLSMGLQPNRQTFHLLMQVSYHAYMLIVVARWLLPLKRTPCSTHSVIPSFTLFQFTWFPPG